MLIDQSAMAGRGKLEEGATLLHSRIFMFRYGHWIIAEEAFHSDNPLVAGVGLGMSLALSWRIKQAWRRSGWLPVR